MTMCTNCAACSFSRLCPQLSCQRRWFIHFGSSSQADQVAERRAPRCIGVIEQLSRGDLQLAEVCRLTVGTFTSDDTIPVGTWHELPRGALGAWRDKF